MAQVESHARTPIAHSILADVDAVLILGQLTQLRWAKVSTVALNVPKTMPRDSLDFHIDNTHCPQMRN